MRLIKMQWNSTLVNLDGVEAIYIREHDIVNGKTTWRVICKDLNRNESYIAEYSTEKQAINALEIISKAYQALELPLDNEL